MQPTPGVETGIGARARRWVASWGVPQWRRAVLTVVLAATALFGGLDTVDKSVTVVTAGDEFSNGLYTMTIERATLVRELNAGGAVLLREKPGMRYLGVVAKVRNDSTLPGTLTDPVDLRGEAASRPVGAMRLADGTRVFRLGPGLTDQIVYIWELPADSIAVADTVTLRIWKQAQRLGYSYGEGWVSSPTDYSRLSLTVGAPR